MYAIVDVETTGTQPGRDRIIEIAICLHDGTSVIKSFHSLVNPGMHIPYPVTQLTGIHDDMVQSAPKFFEVAKEIVKITENAVMVAHNIRFDYSFIKQEFNNLGFNFQRKNLCTLKLARKIIPGLNGYSLENLCKSLRIEQKQKHRALADATATASLFGTLLERSGNVGEPVSFNATVSATQQESLLPELIEKKHIKALPDKPGVYFFYDSAGRVIYVGKSISIRKRVTSHFQIDLKSPKSLDFKNSIVSITCEETGNELVALLYESHLIKKLSPVYNFAQKRQFYGYTLDYHKDDKGYINLKIDRMQSAQHSLIPVSSIASGKGLLFNLVERYNLCQKLCGLYKSKDACFGYHVNKCLGPCCGKEASEDYNKRVLDVLFRFKYPYENFIVKEQGRTPEELAIIWIENSHYMGYGFIDKQFANSVEDLKACVTPQADNKDVQMILRQYLREVPSGRVIIY